MTAEIFLDANVLLYASSNAAEDKTKREQPKR
jgi:predicted nucleic acid-binding protein